MKKLFLSVMLIFAVSCLAAQTAGNAKPQTPGTSGNEQAFSSLEMKVFPNPVQNRRFTLELSNQVLSEIRITNIAGIQVFQKKFTTPVNRYQVLLDQIPDGIYLLRVTSGENLSRTTKLLVTTNP